MKKSILFFVAILLTSLLTAQDYSASQDKGNKKRAKEVENKVVILEKPISNLKLVNPPHEFGIASGITTGYGLSYRYWPNKVGFQLTAFPVVSNEDKNLSLGLNSLIKLDSKKWYRLYAFVGGNFNWTENADYDEFSDGVWGPWELLFNLNPPAEEQKKYTVGLGPGIEFTPGEHFGLNFMTGFRYSYTDFQISDDNRALSLTADFGIYFRW